MKRLLAVVIAAGACAQQGESPARTSADSTPAAERAIENPQGARVEPPGTARAQVGTSDGATQSLLRGKIVVSGTEGMPLTMLETDGRSVFLTGALEPELRALSGATAELRGAQTRRDERVSIEVRSYDVIDIDGERPVIGWWLADNQFLVGPDTLRVSGTIRAPTGAKIWITGDRSGRQISVRSYGIINR
ncbi:MAG: hypothetical protein ACRENP_03830 [Longimicrobiales bacterium]